jgi:molybdenum cofactor cytidylyltransferase
VLLAAGESRRMGGPSKLEIRLDGEPLLHRTARILLAAGVAPLVVVVGHAADRSETLLADLPVATVRNPAWREEGQQGSARRGLAALAPRLAGSGVEGFLIALADLPLLEPEHVRELECALAERGAARVRMPWYQGRRGNPVAFEASLCTELAAEPEGPRGWLDAHPEAVERLVVAHAAFTTDLDTLADVDALRALPGAPRIDLPPLPGGACEG